MTVQGFYPINADIFIWNTDICIENTAYLY